MQQNWVLGGLGALGLLATGGLLYLASRRYALWRRVADTPTARVRSAPMGVVELKGLAQPLGEPLPGPFSGLPCCWWRMTVEQEEVKHTKNGTRREWRQIHESSSLAPFYLEEEGARVLLDPKGAEINAPKLLEATRGGGMDGLLNLASGWLRRIGGQGEAPGLDGLPGPATLQWASGGLLSSRRRLREWRIDAHRPLYCLGALRRQAGEAPMLGQGRQGEPYLISTESEEELLKRLRWGVLGWVFAAALALALSLAALIVSFR